MAGHVIDFAQGLTKDLARGLKALEEINEHTLEVASGLDSVAEELRIIRVLMAREQMMKVNDKRLPIAEDLATWAR